MTTATTSASAPTGSRSRSDLLALCAFALANVILRGLAITLYWAWFVVPTFGCAKIPLVAGIATYFLASMLFKGAPSNAKIPSVRDGVVAVAISVVTLAVGFALSLIV